MCLLIIRECTVVLDVLSFTSIRCKASSIIAHAERGMCFLAGEVSVK